MLEHAEVIRLESQLTVPTRNHAHLSDLWIAIASRIRLAVWAEAFSRVADGYDARMTGAGTVQLVCMSDQRGWVVARGVDLRLRSPSDVEASVRDLVKLANGVVGTTHASSPVPPSQTQSRWGTRFRAALKTSGDAALVVVDAPRRRPKIDTSSAI